MADDPCLGVGKELPKGIKVVEGGSCKGCEGIGMSALLWGRLLWCTYALSSLKQVGFVNCIVLTI